MIYIKNSTEIQTIFIPRNELQKEAYNATIKTYEDGYKDGLEDGKEYQKDQLLNLYVTENGVHEREDGWGTVTVDIPIGDCPECEDCSGAYNEGYEIGKNEGYEDGFQNGYKQGQADCPECEDCPELTTIDITENGSYEGAFNLVNVNVPQNGGECNLEDKWVTPSYNEKDDNGLIVVNPSEGFDGMNRVVLDPQQIYNEGVEEGRNQGGGGESGGDAELGVLDVALENPWTEVYDAKERDGLDGYSVVNIRPEGLVERERNNAVEDYRNNMDSITITENGSYGIDHLTNYPYLDYENVNGYTEFHYTPNDDNFEIEVSYSLGSDPAVMHLVDIGEYSVVLEAGMCYGAKNDERISPEHMGWGVEDKRIHTIKVTREGITLLDNGSFISWGEDLGTISSNIKVGRDFTFKVFTVKINGDTFTPEGDGVFTNSFAVGEAARYGELQISDYPNGFRNVEVNVPSTDNYNHHILTAIGGVVDYGNVPFNVTTFRQKAYNITAFWGDEANAEIVNGNLSPNVLVHSLIIGVSHIGAYSFQNMKRLTDITIRPFIIGDYAFANCKNLNRITLYGLSTAAVDYNISDTAFEGVAEKGVVVLYDDFFNNEEGETWIRNVFMTKLPSEWTFEIIKPKE